MCLLQPLHDLSVYSVHLHPLFRSSWSFSVVPFSFLESQIHSPESWVPNELLLRLRLPSWFLLLPYTQRRLPQLYRCSGSRKSLPLCLLSDDHPPFRIVVFLFPSVPCDGLCKIHLSFPRSRIVKVILRLVSEHCTISPSFFLSTVASFLVFRIFPSQPNPPKPNPSQPNPPKPNPPKPNPNAIPSLPTTTFPHSSWNHMPHPILSLFFLSLLLMFYTFSLPTSPFFQLLSYYYLQNYFNFFFLLVIPAFFGACRTKKKVSFVLIFPRYHNYSHIHTYYMRRY